MEPNTIILCGGLGTRLGSLTRQTPKPLVEVAGVPFLTYLLDRLSESGVVNICLAVSFNWQKVQYFAGDSWKKTTICYSVEQERLGTGGAIRQAFEHTGWDSAFVLNGDTWLNIDLSLLAKTAQSKRADVMMALTQVADTKRYGQVELSTEGRVKEISEKAKSGPGYVNGGAYWVKSGIFRKYDKKRFEFESEFLVEKIKKVKVFGVKTDSDFVDIGIPTDLEKARKYFGSKQHV